MSNENNRQIAKRNPRITVLPSEAGRTYLECGLVIFRESYDYFIKWRETLKNMPMAATGDRDLELGLTIQHESIHFLQCLTVGFLPGHSLKVIKAAGAVLESLRTQRNLSEAKEQFVSICNLLEREHNGISIVDILEGVAVTESFKLTFNDTSLEQFKLVLAKLFPAKPIREQYTKTYQVLSEKVGEQDSLDFLAPLSFIALNFDEPVKAFHDLVSTLTPDKVRQHKHKSASDLFRHLGIDQEKHFLFSLDDCPESDHHPVLFRCIRYALSKIGAHLLFEIGARPHLLKTFTLTSLQHQSLLPPFSIYSTASNREPFLGLHGLAKVDEELLRNALYLSATIGAAERLTFLSDKQVYQFCPQKGHCPHYDSALCYRWFAPPPIIGDWENCDFLKTFEIAVGKPIKQVWEQHHDGSIA